MSEAVTELGGRVVEGWVTVRDAGLRGMITLRGDLGDAKLHAACRDVTGVDVPDVRGVASQGQSGAAWMAPDELLIMVPYTQVEAALTALHKALKGQHYLAVNVSDARSVMWVEGQGAREVIAKLAPVDLHPDNFGPGELRRTRLGQVAAAFWMRDEATFEVVCFRSVAEYCMGLLSASAAGGPVGVFDR